MKKLLAILLLIPSLSWGEHKSVDEELANNFLKEFNIESSSLVKVPSRNSSLFDKGCDFYWRLLGDYPDLDRIDRLRLELPDGTAECTKLPPESFGHTSTCYVECQKILAEVAERKKSDERIDNMRNLEDYQWILANLTNQFDNDLWFQKTSESCMGPSSHAGIVVSQIENSYQQACRNISEGDTSFSNICTTHIYIDIGVKKKVSEWVDSCYSNTETANNSEIDELESQIKSKPKECNKSRKRKFSELYSSRANCNSNSECSFQEAKANRLQREMDRICGNGVKSDRDILNEAVGKALRKLF